MLSLTLEYSMPMSSPAAPSLTHLRHFALLPSRRKVRGFFNFDFGIGFLWGHLGVTSQTLGSGARREAKEIETEAGKGWQSSDLKMAVARKSKG